MYGPDAALALRLAHGILPAGAPPLPDRPQFASGGVPALLPAHLGQALAIAGAGRWHNALAGRRHFDNGGPVDTALALADQIRDYRSDTGADAAASLASLPATSSDFINSQPNAAALQSALARIRSINGADAGSFASPTQGTGTAAPSQSSAAPAATAAPIVTPNVTPLRAPTVVRQPIYNPLTGEYARGGSVEHALSIARMLHGRPRFSDGGDSDGGNGDSSNSNSNSNSDNEGGGWGTGGYGVNNSGGTGGSVTAGTSGVSSDDFGGGYSSGSVTAGGSSSDGWGGGTSGGFGVSGSGDTSSVGSAMGSVGGYASPGSIGNAGDSVAGTVSSPGFSNFGASDASNTEDGLNGNNSFSPTQGHFVGSIGSNQQGNIGGFTDHSNNSYGDSGNGFGGMSNGFGNASQGEVGFGGFDSNNSVGAVGTGFSGDVDATGGFEPSMWGSPSLSTPSDASFGTLGVNYGPSVSYGRDEFSKDHVTALNQANVDTAANSYFGFTPQASALSYANHPSAVASTASAGSDPYGSVVGVGDVTGDPSSVDGMHALTVHGFGTFSGPSAGDGSETPVGYAPHTTVGDSPPSDLSTPDQVHDYSVADIAQNFGQLGYATQFGLSPSYSFANPSHVASVVRGNMTAESAFDPGAVQSQSIGGNAPTLAQGLSQMYGGKNNQNNPGSYTSAPQSSDDRQSSMLGFVAARAGVDPSTLDARVVGAQTANSNLDAALGTVNSQIAQTLGQMAANPAYAPALRAATDPGANSLVADTLGYERNFEASGDTSSYPARVAAALQTARNLSGVNGTGDPVGPARVAMADGALNYSGGTAPASAGLVPGFDMARQQLAGMRQRNDAEGYASTLNDAFHTPYTGPGSLPTFASADRTLGASSPAMSAGSGAPSTPSGLAGYSPSDLASLGQAAGLGTVGATPGGLTNTGYSLSGDPAAAAIDTSGLAPTVGQTSPTKAAEDAGFSNPALATGVAAAAEQAVGVPGMLGKLASDPGYSDVRSAIENGQSPVEVAHALANALGNDPAAVKSMLATGIGIDVGSLAKSIDSNTTAAGQPISASNPNADLAGGSLTYAGAVGSQPAVAQGLAGLTINGVSPAGIASSDAPSSYAPDSSMPATSPSITAAPATSDPVTITPAQQDPSLWSKARRAKDDSLATRAAETAVNFGVGFVPGVGLVNGLSAMLGGPNIGALVAHTATPGTANQVTGGASSNGGIWPSTATRGPVTSTSGSSTDAAAALARSVLGGGSASASAIDPNTIAANALARMGGGASGVYVTPAYSNLIAPSPTPYSGYDPLTDPAVLNTLRYARGGRAW